MTMLRGEGRATNMKSVDCTDALGGPIFLDFYIENFQTRTVSPYGSTSRHFWKKCMVGAPLFFSMLHGI